MDARRMKTMMEIAEATHRFPMHAFGGMGNAIYVKADSDAEALEFAKNGGANINLNAVQRWNNDRQRWEFCV